MLSDFPIKMTQSNPTDKTLTPSHTADEILMLVKKFNAVSVKHSSQTNAKKDVEFALTLCESVSIIVLAGPTGVGKTRLIEAVVGEQLTANLEKMKNDPAFVPIVATTAIAHGHRKFDFRRCYLDCLLALGDRFAAKRTRTPEEIQRAKKERFKSAGESISAALLRMDLERELERRGTITWVLDEADHILTGGATGKPGDQFDALKSFAQITGITLILLGTGKLPTYLSASGQLSRRTKVVVLPHYQWDDDRQVSQYVSAFHSLMAHLPTDGFPAVTENVEEFFMGGVGCVGVAKDWIARAFAKMLTDGCRVLDMGHFRDTRLSPVQLQTMALELQEALQWLRSEKSDQKLKMMLGMSKPAQLTQQSSTTAPPQPPRARGGKPFTRAPGRDPLGVVRGATDAVGV